MTVDDAKQVTFYRHRREEVNVFKMNSQISALETQLASMAVMVKEAKDMATKTKTDVDSKVTKDIATLKASTAKDLLAVKTNVAGSITTAAAATEQKLKAAATDTAGKITTLSNKVAATALTTKNEVAAVAKGVTSPPIHMWSGGPKSHSRGSNWADFTYDRVDFDTLQPFAKVLSKTRFVALQSGYFRMSVDAMAYTANRGQKHFQFMVSNRNINGNSHYTNYGW